MKREKLTGKSLEVGAVFILRNHFVFYLSFFYWGFMFYSKKK